MSKAAGHKHETVSQHDPGVEDDGEEDIFDLGPLELSNSADVEISGVPRPNLPPKSRRADISPASRDHGRNNFSGRWRNWCILIFFSCAILWLVFKYWAEFVKNETKQKPQYPQNPIPDAQSKSNSSTSQISNKSSGIPQKPAEPLKNATSNSSVNNTSTIGKENRSNSVLTNNSSSTEANQAQTHKPNEPASNNSTNNTSIAANKTNPQTPDPIHPEPGNPANTNKSSTTSSTEPPQTPGNQNDTQQQQQQQETQEPAVSYYWVVHTHLDLGWLQPEQELYDIKARSMFDTTLDYLKRNPDARMTFSDFAFIYMYIHEPDIPAEFLAKRKQNLQAAFDSGQLEAVNGGFVLPDFAVTSHDELLSNWQIGKRWGRKHFNVSVSTMWSIDQFGYSKVVTRLAKECGFHENFINRIIHEYQGLLRKNGDIIFRWKYGNNTGDDLVSLQLEEHYEILKFRVDPAFWGVSEFMITNQEYILGTNFNFVNSCVDYFDYVHKWTNYTKSRVKLIPFGGDFHFSNYPNTIHFIEMLTLCVKSNNHTGRFAGKFDVRTTTLAEFLKALKSDFATRNISISTFTFDESSANTSFPAQALPPAAANTNTNFGDLLPYTEYFASNRNRKTWSGYYSTAPFAKKIMRSHGELHRGMRSVFAAAGISRREVKGKKESEKEMRDMLDRLEESDWAVLGNLHHDAITGVSTNFVNSHYVSRSQTNIKESRLEWKDFFNTLVAPELDESELSNQTRLITYDRESLRHRRYEHSRFNDAFYDRQERVLKRDGYDIRFAFPAGEYWSHQGDFPDYLILNQAGPGKKIFRIHSSAAKVQIRLNPNTTEESNQTNNTSRTPAITQPHSTFKLKADLYEHIFTSDFAPFESKLLQILPENTTRASLKYETLQADKPLHTPNTTVSLANNTQLVLQIPQTKLHLSVGFFEYKYNESNIEVVGEEKGDPFGDERFGPVLMKVKPPGKYIFTTTVKDARPLNISSAKYSWSESSSELHVILFYSKEQCTLNVYYIPSAPQGQQLSTRLICLKKYRAAYDRVIRFGLLGPRDDDGTFLTDSNALDRIRRRRFARSQFIETNYYPITRFISIEDKMNRLSVIVDRPQGGTSPAAGVVEVMVDRESVTSDDLGIFDYNVEMESINVLHYVVWETVEPKDDCLYRRVQISEDSPPVVVQLLPLYKGTSFALNSTALRSSSHSTVLSPHLKVFVDTTDGTDFFVRLHHLHDSQSLSVDVAAVAKELFGSAPKAVVEYSLDFAKSVAEMEREAPERAWPGERTPWRHPSDQPDKSVYQFGPLKVQAFKLEF